jgi:hypothetical protein
MKFFLEAEDLSPLIWDDIGELHDSNHDHLARDIARAQAVTCATWILAQPIILDHGREGRLVYIDDLINQAKQANVQLQIKGGPIVESHEQTVKSRKMRDLSLVIGILTSCKEEIQTVELFTEVPPEVAKDLKEAEALILKARDSAVREFSRPEK